MTQLKIETQLLRNFTEVICCLSNREILPMTFIDIWRSFKLLETSTGPLSRKVQHLCLRN